MINEDRLFDLAACVGLNLRKTHPHHILTNAQLRLLLTHSKNEAYEEAASTANQVSNHDLANESFSLYTFWCMGTADAAIAIRKLKVNLEGL